MNVTKEEREKQKNVRLGATNINTKGEPMKVIEYNSADDVLVEFQDEWKRTARVKWYRFTTGKIKNPHDYDIIDNRVGQENYNNQGDLMRVIDYKKSTYIMIEFQDKYKAQIKTIWDSFKSGEIRNPYHPSVCNIGIVGNKYPIRLNNRNTKEYIAWKTMIGRCYNEKYKEKYPTYKDVTVCKEWFLFENFYEWLHSQENFDKWFNGNYWAVDKDILVKGNKIYSPDTCCLVPGYINTLFVKRDACRGDLPIGVHTKNNKYYAFVIYGKHNNCQKTTVYQYPTPEDAFYLGYKPTKEAYIKRIAQEEYDKDNITEKCYNAMMNYEVEITD